MNKFTIAVSRIFSGILRSMIRFPAAMLSAFAIAAIATVRVQLDTHTHDKLFTSLQLSFLLGAALAMALTVLVIGLTQRKSFFWAANLTALLVAGTAFLLIYLPVGDLAEIAAARIIALSAAAIILFLLFISRDPAMDFNQASFMTLKASLIAAVYALVIMLGLMFIAFTVESLLYKAMDEKVYMHISVWSAFAWFAFFLGYFPDFRRGATDPQHEIAGRQPRFAEVLFAYVLVPLMSLLTAVLLIWAIQILVVGDWPSFNQLSVIFTTYTLFGIFLAVMISHYPQPVARWYKKVFPFAALVFLAFEAYAWVSQIQMNGFMTNTYFIAILWLLAVAGALVLLIAPIAKNRLIAWLASGLCVLIILPWVGYHEAPVLAQQTRLKNVLIRNQMLSDSKIQPAPATISEQDKVIISRSADFLLNVDDVRKADWFSGSIRSYSEFKLVFGFEYTTDTGEPIARPDKFSVDLELPAGSVAIVGYTHAAYPSYEPFADFNASDAAIRVELIQSDGGQDIALSVQKDRQEIYLQDLRPWLDDLALRYQDINWKETQQAPSIDDLTFSVEREDFRLLVVFQSVWISWQEDAPNSRSYSAFMYSVFYGEKD
ncbi:MAG: hypothetical protein SCM11_07445 [Bacillota bacterium]|nr:hypothetical protein [Bacillota bacterium]